LKQSIAVILFVVRHFMRDADPASLLCLVTAGLTGAAVGGWWRGRSATQ
jgi:hypothetical protein